MSWIKTINFEESSGTLRKTYLRVRGPGGQIDNILKVHSLRPHTLVGHMQLYKNVLHHTSNELPKWYLETIGVYVSLLNKCDYCVQHHSVGLGKLIGQEKSNTILDALRKSDVSQHFEPKYQYGLKYSEELTLRPTEVSKSMINQLRKEGLSDGEMLEINQVVAYFNYANRTVQGLGVNIDGEVLGTSPSSSDSTDWGHQ